jgi:copper homeostasis protein (lipoprotein)
MTQQAIYHDSSAVVPAHGLRLPATFRGGLPCADCAGVRHHLNLWPDQIFHLRREWLDKNSVHSDIGRWRIVSDLTYELQSNGTLEPIDVSLLLGGEMTCMADSPRFTECPTGRNYPIVPGNEALRLQRAFIADVKEPGTQARDHERAPVVPARSHHSDGLPATACRN